MIYEIPTASAALASSPPSGWHCPFPSYLHQTCLSATEQWFVRCWDVKNEGHFSHVARFQSALHAYTPLVGSSSRSFSGKSEVLLTSNYARHGAPESRAWRRYVKPPNMNTHIQGNTQNMVLPSSQRYAPRTQSGESTRCSLSVVDRPSLNVPALLQTSLKRASQHL